MRKFIVGISFLALSACATNRELYINENGETVYQADCGGMRQDMNMGDCLMLAGKQCPKGFNIIMTNDQVSGVIGGAQAFGRTNSNLYAQGQAGIFANNAFVQGLENSQTSFNTNGWGGNSFRRNRYIIYTCK